MTADSTENSSAHRVASAVPALQLALLCCVLLILGSAIAVVYLAQQSRLLFAELETLRGTQHDLDTRWSRLVLERSTLLSPANVERVARNKLAMHLPPPHEVVVVQP